MGKREKLTVYSQSNGTLLSEKRSLIERKVYESPGDTFKSSLRNPALYQDAICSRGNGPWTVPCKSIYCHCWCSESSEGSGTGRGGIDSSRIDSVETIVFTLCNENFGTIVGTLVSVILGFSGDPSTHDEHRRKDVTGIRDDDDPEIDVAYSSSSETNRSKQMECILMRGMRGDAGC